MPNSEVVILVGKSTLSLIDETQYKLKSLSGRFEEENYLILTELYSLRTRAYIVINESQFFKLDQDLSLLKLINIFDSLKEKIRKINNLSQIKKIVFLMSLLISAIGLGESEIILVIISKMEKL